MKPAVATDAARGLFFADKEGPVTVDMRVRLGRLELANPVLTASGTFGFGAEFAEFFPLAKLGAAVTKTVTLKPRRGNPPPRVTETPAGMLNAIGLANPGIKRFLDEELPQLAAMGVKVIVNVAGEYVEDYETLTRNVHRSGLAAGVELNVSCPNVASGGMAFGSDPTVLSRLVAGCRRATSLPLAVKLTPNVTDITVVARAAEGAGADALTTANTVLAMVVDWRTRRPILGNITGGLSGPAIKPVALRMVWQASRSVKIPVIGAGGVMTAEDVLEFVVAGATAVQVGTANLVDPRSAGRIVDELPALVSESGASSIRELIGSLRA